MQDFVNHAALRRGLSALEGLGRRHAAVAVATLVLAAAAGPALAAIWLGLTLLVAETGKTLQRRLDSDDGAARFAITAAAETSLAAAPALIWFARAELGPALALTLVGMFVARTLGASASATPRLLPYAGLGLLFALDIALRGEFTLALAAIVVLGFVAGHVRATLRAAKHEQAQDAEFVRQSNMAVGERASAAWELDYQAKTLIGGHKLAALLGRSLTYADIIDRACFATPGDYELARAAFSPCGAVTRRIAFEHDALDADGRTIRLRHEGFLRANAEGVATRLTCTTKPAAAVDGKDVLCGALARTEHILQSQARAISVISNELGRHEAPPAAAVSPNCVDLALAHNIELIEIRRGVIASAIDELVRTHHEAQAANLAKSQFLAGMSHELRTPLNAIIGYAEMLHEDAEDNSDDRAAQDLNRILAAGRHLLSLINEILDLSKIEAGRVEVSPAPFEVDASLADLLETVRPLAEQNGNKLTFVNEVEAFDADTDATKLSQCVLNLLSNACKFTHNGDIEMRLARLDLHGVPHICITVSDTGIGIDAEQMNRLFQPFVQGDASISRKYGGTGLGLTITRKLAQLMGGNVSVTSEAGLGATFTLRVPANFSDAAKALGAAAEVDAVKGAEDAPLVLVIEDEPDARELAARALTRAGFAVQGVGGGEAGLALARAKAPALILLDIFLPDRSGWRVLQSLKHDAKTRDIPVVVLSINEDRAHAIALGAAEHLVKPADRDMLAATVMRLARKRPALAAAIAWNEQARQLG